MVLLILIQTVSCQESSPLIDTTTEAIPTTTKPSNPQTPDQRIDRRSDLDEPCPCNLHPQSCDMNCCCDDDNCSQQEKNLFSVRCQPERKSYLDAHSCQVKDRQLSSSPFAQFMYSSSSHLFCVETINARKQDYYVNRNPFKSILDVQKITPRHAYNWTPGAHETHEFPQVSTTSFKIGNPLHLITVSDSGEQPLATWKLPSSFFANEGLCDTHRQVAFLEDFSTSCLRFIQNLTEDCQTFLNSASFDNFLISSVPSSLFSSIEGRRKSNPGAKCLDNGHCVHIRDNSSLSTVADEKNRKTTCLEAVRRATYYVWFEVFPTTRIVRIDINFQRVNLSGSKGYIRQFFDVKFIQDKSAVNTSSIEEDKPLSGNPGYQWGSPIRAADFPDVVSGSNYSESIPVANLSIPSLSTDNGICSNSPKQEVIPFGINIHSGCLIVLKREQMSDVFSPMICSEIQKQISTVLETTNGGYVGMFGNANSAKRIQWIRVSGDEDKTQVHDPSSSGRCSQLITGLSYEIYYALTGDVSEPQAKILFVTKKYSWKTSVDVSPLLSVSSSKFRSPQSEFRLEIMASASFFDMTHSKRSKDAPSPVLRFSLPPDFFYPFTNSVTNCHPQVLTLFMFLVVLPLFL